MWVVRLAESIAAIGAAIYVIINLVRLAQRYVAWRKLLPVVCLVCLPTMTQGAACTKGTNCYCDTVESGGTNEDAALLLCEDYDFPGLYSNVGAGNGAPFYGPVYDDTGFPGNRGWNSYMVKRYNDTNGLVNMIWAGGQPASPTLGPSCGETLCHGLKVWHPTNLWDGNAYQPNVAFHFQDSDFGAEVGTITPPTNTADGGDGVFDGNAIMAFRYQTVAGNNNGTTMSDLSRWAGTRHLGVTYALAVPNNFVSSGLTSRSGNTFLKFAEFQRTDNVSLQEGLAGFGYAGNGGFAHPQFPFYGFLFNPSNCLTAIAGVTQTKGSISCFANDPGGPLQWFGDTSYQFPRDWPEGTWGCVRTDIDFTTVSSGHIRMWVKTSVLTTETLVVDISGINGSAVGNMNGGWSGVMFNGWSNGYDDVGPPTEITFRYEDNYHVRNGTPVSCAQIGFGGSPPPSIGSSTLIFVEFIGAVSSMLEALFICGYFWERRMVAVRAAVGIWQWVLVLPTPHEMYWIYRYRSAVKRWQRQAPPMLPAPSQTIDLPPSTIRHLES